MRIRVRGRGSVRVRGRGSVSVVGLKEASAFALRAFAFAPVVRTRGRRGDGPPRRSWWRRTRRRHRRRKRSPRRSRRSRGGDRVGGGRGGRGGRRAPQRTRGRREPRRRTARGRARRAPRRRRRIAPPPRAPWRILPNAGAPSRAPRRPRRSRGRSDRPRGRGPRRRSTTTAWSAGKARAARRRSTPPTRARPRAGTTGMRPRRCARALVGGRAHRAREVCRGGRVVVLSNVARYDFGSLSAAPVGTRAVVLPVQFRASSPSPGSTPPRRVARLRRGAEQRRPHDVRAVRHPHSRRRDVQRRRQERHHHPLLGALQAPATVHRERPALAHLRPLSLVAPASVQRHAIHPGENPETSGRAQRRRRDVRLIDGKRCARKGTAGTGQGRACEKDEGNLARRRGVGEARAGKQGTGSAYRRRRRIPPAAAIVLGNAPILVPDARVDSDAARSAGGARDLVAVTGWIQSHIITRANSLDK